MTLLFIILGIILLLYIACLPKNTKFRSDDGRLLEISKKGGLRVCMEDEATRNIYIEERKRYASIIKKIIKNQKKC